MKAISLQYITIGLVLTGIVAASSLSGLNARPSTYTAVLGLMLGAATVTLISWRNALPTDTIAQLLQRTEANEQHRMRNNRRDG
jgi:hypothetical protein